MKPTINFANPCSIFLIVWSITLFLMLLRLTDNIVPLNTEILSLIGINMGTSIIIYVSFYLIFLSFKQYSQEEKRRNLESSLPAAFLQKTMGLWIIGSVVDIVYSNGVPILWALMGSDKNYTHFGIPSFHGIVNALYLFSITGIFIEYLVTKNKKKLVFVFLLACWPVVMLGRGILLTALIQMLGAYFILTNLNMKRISILILFALISIVLFGIIGDIRDIPNQFQHLLSGENISLFEKLPSGFLWAYIYVTTGINNVAANIQTIQPLYEIHYSIINLLPSIVRTQIEGYMLNASLLDLVDPALNTSSFYSGYISDFGFWGGVVGCALLQLCATFFFFKAKAGIVPAIMAYAIFFQCLIFSIFYDLFLLLPYLFQLFLCMFVQIDKDCLMNYRKIPA